jgi:hypothetical protein
MVVWKWDMYKAVSGSNLGVTRSSVESRLGPAKLYRNKTIFLSRSFERRSSLPTKRSYVRDPVFVHSQIFLCRTHALTEILTKPSVLWGVSVVHSRSTPKHVSHLPSRCFLAWQIFLSWRWRLYLSPNLQFRLFFVAGLVFSWLDHNNSSIGP